MLQIFLCLSQFQIFCSTVPKSYQNIPIIPMFLYPNCIFYMASFTQKQLINLADHAPEFGLWKMFTLRKKADQQLVEFNRRDAYSLTPVCKALCWAL